MQACVVMLNLIVMPAWQTPNLVFVQQNLYCTNGLVPNPPQQYANKCDTRSLVLLLQVDGDLQCEPVCQCGLKFCFQCGLDPHSPCTCEMYAGHLVPPASLLDIYSLHGAYMEQLDSMYLLLVP